MLFLESENAVKSGTRYSWDLRNNDQFDSFQIKDVVGHYKQTTTEPGTVDFSGITALTPAIWLRMANTSKITPAGAVDGSSVATITSSGPPGITFVGSSATAVKYRTIGQAPCIRSESNWHAMMDGSSPQASMDGDHASYYCLLKTPSGSLDRLMWRDRVFRWRVSGGTVHWGGLGSGTFNTAGHPWHDSGMVLAPDTVYILSATYDRTDNKKLTSELLAVDTDTTQTGAVINFASHTALPSPDTSYKVHISSAQTGFVGYSLGDTIVYNGSGNHYSTTIAYLKSLYTGVTNTTVSIPRSLTLHSDYLTNCRSGKSYEKETALQLVPLDSTHDTKGIYKNKDSETFPCDEELKVVDFYWTNALGQELELDFSVVLRINNVG